MESLKPSTAGVDSRFAAKSTSQDDSTTLPPVGLEYPGEGKKRRMEVDDAAALIVPERSIGAQSTNALDR